MPSILDWQNCGPVSQREIVRGVREYVALAPDEPDEVVWPVPAAAPPPAPGPPSGPPPDLLAALPDLLRTITGSTASGEVDYQAVRLYYGLDGAPGTTLQEVGDVLGFTRERARQRKA